MNNADRVAQQRADAARAQEQAERDAERRRIEHVEGQALARVRALVPEVLRQLEARGFPDVQQKAVTGPRAFRGTKQVTRAAWPVADYTFTLRGDTIPATIYLLSTGQFLFNNGSAQDLEPRHGPHAEAIASGLRKLIADTA